MTLTPEQLDAIATKLLGWKRVWIDPTNQHEFPITVMHGDFWQRKDGSLVNGPGLSQSSRHDALLVLEAMGEWCEKNSMSAATRETQLTSSGRGWVCEIIERTRFEDDAMLTSELGNTIPEAVFKCAAKLVERM